MAKEVIHIKSADLRCDACDYTIANMEPSEEHIGKPCPNCGANMLTREDYESAILFLRFSEVMNALLGPLFGKEKAGGGTPVSVNPRADSLTIRKKPA